ncbi:MAG TPA: DUF6289 family protein [Thermoanaerobaculia bacterium]|nr:DUF6289 family protein [Thermoanaerobaculia bacterium]
MKRGFFLVVTVVAFIVMSYPSVAFPDQLDSAAAGGWVTYYDENWNLVGEWYKPCQGQASRWGVVGVYASIDEYYSCEGGPEPPSCTPWIVYDAPSGNLPNPSLACYQ